MRNKKNLRMKELIHRGMSIPDDFTLEQYNEEISSIEDKVKETEKKLFFTTLIKMDYNEHVRYFGNFIASGPRVPFFCTHYRLVENAL